VPGPVPAVPGPVPAVPGPVPAVPGPVPAVPGPVPAVPGPGYFRAGLGSPPRAARSVPRDQGITGRSGSRSPSGSLDLRLRGWLPPNSLCMASG